MTVHKAEHRANPGSNNPERCLWHAVIQQALNDALGNISQLLRLSDQVEARRWLTKPSAEFTDACNLAGLDEDAVRTFAVKAIEKADDKPSDAKGKRTGRKGRLIEYEGRSLTVSQWAARLGVKPLTIDARFKAGWPIEKALNKPSIGSGPRRAMHA